MQLYTVKNIMWLFQIRNSSSFFTYIFFFGQPWKISEKWTYQKHNKKKKNPDRLVETIWLSNLNVSKIPQWGDIQ